VRWGEGLSNGVHSAGLPLYTGRSINQTKTNNPENKQDNSQHYNIQLKSQTKITQHRNYVKNKEINALFTHRKDKTRQSQQKHV